MGCPFKCRENQAKTRHKFNKPQSFAACGFRKTAMLSVGGRSCQIGVHPLWPETYPTLPIRAYSSRVLSGGNASGNFRKSGKDRRFGLWENPWAGEVQSNRAILGKTDCRGGWSKGSQQPQHQPKTSALPMDRPSFPPSQQPDATAGVATARRIASNHCAAMAASIRRTASSLSHGAGPFMAAIWQPSLSTIIVTGRPNARFLRLSSLNTPMVGSR